jgi:hypothetical protein
MMTTLPTDYSHEQLVDALAGCYDFYLHQMPMEDDLTLEDYITSIESMTHSQLVDETGCDGTYPLDEFMNAWT